LYFSFVTTTTLGYGDIKPKADASVAQSLVIVEVVMGVYFIAVLIARLIDLSPKEKDKKTDDKREESIQNMPAPVANNGTNEGLKT
jgi:hypothetical protein